MNLIDQIKADQLLARKQKEAIRASLLTTLIGEADMVGKNAGNRAPTDAEVVAVVKKFLKNIDETLKVVDPTSAGYALAKEEQSILVDYQPKQISADALRTMVNEIICYYENAGDTANVGLVMKVLKAKFDGQYDGKLASSIIAEELKKFQKG